MNNNVHMCVYYMLYVCIAEAGWHGAVETHLIRNEKIPSSNLGVS